MELALPLGDRTLTLRLTVALALCAGALTMSGCSSSSIDSMPLWAGGEPAAMPARPSVTSEFPAVNDRPPPRDTKPITEEEQAKAERELVAARSAQAIEAETVKNERGGTSASKAKSSARMKAAQARNKQKNQQQD
jgi:hypothetical protein